MLEENIIHSGKYYDKRNLFLKFPDYQYTFVNYHQRIIYIYYYIYYIIYRIIIYIYIFL